MSMLRIEVIQDDIDKGKQSNTDGCAVARALKRQGIDNVSVSALSIMINGTFHHTPEDISRFIHDFDKSKKLVFPQEFLLDTSEVLPAYAHHICVA
jgi:hypothetical protein